MKHAVRLLATGTAIAMALTAPAVAADLPEPEIIETPVFEAPERVPHKMSGWYIRGDVGYSFNSTGDIDYINYGCGGCVAGSTGILRGELGDSFSIGGGLGYQINHYARVDATLDYNFSSDFEGSTAGTCDFTGVGGPAGPIACTSADVATFSALTVLANAYVDLGTYVGITPYVGAGFGGARVHWGELTNTECEDVPTGPGGAPFCNTRVHEGSQEWRFAYALMAGLSYNVSKKLTLDVGYRYKRIQGGRMFGFNGNGPGFDDGITSHEVRAGVRYKFGGKHHRPMQQVSYHPTPVYK